MGFSLLPYGSTKITLTTKLIGVIVNDIFVRLIEDNTWTLAQFKKEIEYGLNLRLKLAIEEVNIKDENEIIEGNIIVRNSQSVQFKINKK